MPADKKKSNSGEAKAADAPKLHADAKEFVPSGVILQATAAAWAPNSSKAAVVSPSAAPKAGKVAPAKNGANSGNKAAAPAAAPSAVADAKKQPPKSAAPVKGAWGKKPSDAIKNAAPIKPQQQPAQERQPQQQQQHGKGGRAAPDNKDGRWKRGEKSGKKTDNSSGGGGNSGGSWARAAAKPGDDGDKGGHRQHSRGEKGSHSHGERGGGDEQSWQRGKVVPVELLNPGQGTTDEQKAVARISVQDLLDMRLRCLDAPSSWEGENAEKPPPAALWDSPTRVSEIEEASKAPRMTGDVSVANKGRRGGKGGKGNPNDTAPPLEDCKPIEVNEETRWKAKVMEGKDAEAAEEVADSTEEVLRKALLLMNKLSLTKFEKISDEFINCGIGRDIECLTAAVSLIVTKAQEEQHFSSMYAGLCLKLASTPMEGIDEGSKKGKKFKKILLERCQTEFETDTATKIKEATKDVTDPDEIAYHSNLCKKHYLGHMRFIGELYKGDLISIKIMLWCLPALLKGDDVSSDDKDSTHDFEEKVECFTKLMTVIGDSLEKQSEAMRSVGKKDAAESLANCWKAVEIIAGKRKEEGPKVSNRIKFMLQDLLEMKAKGWVTRRKEETAKTIAQIHNEVAKEERAAARRSSSTNSLRGMGKPNMKRGSSSGDVRNSDKAQSKPQVDADGFVSVAPSKVGRSSSMTTLQRSQSDGSWMKPTAKPEIGRKSSSGKFAVLNESSSRKSGSDKKGSSDKANNATDKTDDNKPKANYLSPDECGDKAKNIVKEFFVGGDTADAILSIHELVGAGHEGDIERGSKVVDSTVLMVLEMKQEEVDKLLSLLLQCAKENKIAQQSFVSGLNDPLEFLSDVAIDAPLAVPHLASIVAELVKAEAVPFDFLLNAPEYFRTDQNAADFGAQVMKKIGDSAIASAEFIEVIEKLMTDEDKANHSSASDLIAAV